MSLLHWFVSRVIPLSLLGATTLYLILVPHSVFGAERGILIGILLFIFASLWFKNLVTHPAYGPTLLCFIVGLFFYESWQFHGLHARGTVALGILLCFLVIFNLSKLTQSPEL
jgi:hypothetical protein